jgi:putative transposase
MNYRYRIYPDATQEETLFEWMEICRRAYNYGLREIKDWCNSRKCLVDRCSLEQEYILPADLKFPNELNQLNALPGAKKEFPKLGEVPSQVLQQAIKQQHHRMGGISRAGVWISEIQKVWAVQIFAVPTVQGMPCNGA